MVRKIIIIALALIVSAHIWADGTMPLNFTAVNGPATVALLQSGSTPPTVNLQYSVDSCVTWSTYTIGDTISLASDSTVYFKALTTNEALGCYLINYYHYYHYFSMTGTVSADGNIMSLLDATMTQTQLPHCAFCYLFKNCISLVKAPELSITALGDRCYGYMFFGCTSLTQAPALPADTLANYCYEDMFRDCTSLTQAPALPADSLAHACYSRMFSGCTSLTQAPVLPATTLADGCYASMFLDCTSLTQAPALPATTLAGSCYSRMFQGCSSLTQAPTLPVTTLAYRCYINMFAGCTTLTQAPTLPATTLADGCYSNMFEDCTSLTQAPALPATTLADECYISMFLRCTSLTHAPALPADSLAESCYYSMFYNCTSLRHIHPLSVTSLAENCCKEMYSGCSRLVVNNESPGMPWSIPSNVQNQDSTSLQNMFYGTGGTMNGTPSVGTTYYITSVTLQVTVNTNDSTMGTVTGGGGTYNYGDTITLVATPAAGHHFVSWSNDSTTDTMTFILTQDTTLIATFEADAFTGIIGDNLYWSIDSLSGELLFSGSGSTPDYSPTDHAPWYYNRSYVTHITMPAGVISHLGDYAFDDFTNLYYTELNADTIGASVYNGCSSLTLGYSETNAVANANTMDGCNANPVLIVHDYQWYKHTYTDSLALALNIYPYLTDYTQDSLQTMNATVTLLPSYKGISVIATRHLVNGAPLHLTDDCNIIWKDSLVAPLVYEFLSQGAEYLGKNSFLGCTTLHRIIVSPKYWGTNGTTSDYAYAHLDSIHADAFDSIYPDIVDLYEETLYQPGKVMSYTAQKNNLGQTLLYVPDTLAATGKSMLAQYTATPYWNDNFADINNKNIVDTQYVDTASAHITFYYQDVIDSVPVESYRTVIYKVGGTDTADIYFSNDTTFTINRLPRRIIQIVDSVTGNTTTVTITINHSAYNPNIQEVNVQIEHLAENSSYSITISPLDGLGNVLASDSCTLNTTTIVLSDQTITEDYSDKLFFPTEDTDVYLINGNYIGKYSSSLPPGVYLMREGKKWYKFAKTR